MRMIINKIEVTDKQITKICPKSTLSGILNCDNSTHGEGVLHIKYNDFRQSSENLIETFLLQECFYVAQYIAIKSNDPFDNLFWIGSIVSIKNADFTGMHDIVRKNGFDAKIKYSEIVNLSLRCGIKKNEHGYNADIDGFIGSTKIFTVSMIISIQTKDQFTLSIIKPDAVMSGHMSAIFNIIKNNNLRIAKMNMHGIVVSLSKRVRLTLEQAHEFYGIHKSKPFFNDLCAFMTSGDCIISVLCGKNAVNSYRQIMGSTNPEHAQEGTIRKLYGKSIDHNAMHGSDSIENAKIEIDQMFPGYYKKLSRI